MQNLDQNAVGFNVKILVLIRLNAHYYTEHTEYRYMDD